MTWRSVKIKETIINGNDMEVGTELERQREENSYNSVRKVTNPLHDFHTNGVTKTQQKNCLHDGSKV
jgi:hypothetical protein